MWFFFMLIFNTVSILWQNTNQVIPVGDDLSNYKYKPTAELYLNNQLVKDNSMYYEYEVDHTFFSVVRTNVVGVYTVKYKVTFPTYGFSAVQTISFDVKDLISPMVSAPKFIDVDLGAKNINFEQYVTYADNYNSKEELTVVIQSHLVNTSDLGIYPVYITVRDQSNNQTTTTIMVNVIDQIPPTITQKKVIELGINETIKIDDYFTIKDNYDAVFLTHFDDSLINYSAPGTYRATLNVYDQSSNLASTTFYVYIKDQSSPILKLRTTEITINYQAILPTSELRSIIQEVADDVTNLTIDDVIIRSYVDSDFLGTYEVIYEISDEHQNKTTQILKVFVKDLSDPTIEMIDDIVIDVLTVAPNYIDYLIINDNYNDYSELVIDIKISEVKVQTVGQYWIYVTVKDTSKNEVTRQVLVSVVDREKPKMTMLQTVTVTDFKKPDYQAMITATDNYDKTPMLIIHDEDVLYHIVGSYVVLVIASDSSGNEVSQNVLVEIIDVYYPVLTLYTQLIKHDYQKEAPNYKAYIKEVYDVYDKNLTIDDVLIIDQVNYEKLGLYEVIFELTDPQGLKTVQILFVDVTDFNAPTIEVSPMHINQGDVFDLTRYVKAFDDYDGEITIKVQMNPQTIPTHIPGIYEITFYVHDSTGNYAQQKTYLTIEESDGYLDYVYYGLGVIIVGTIYTLYFFYRRRHPKIH